MSEKQSNIKQSIIRLHHLRPAVGEKKQKTRVGRGIAAGKGKTAGRGTKGTKARGKVRLGFEGGQMPLHMRLPKNRGFKNPFHVHFQVVNLDKLSVLYPNGGTVTVDDLLEKGAVRPKTFVKILGQGELSAKFDITADAFSQSALDKIKAKGGTATLTAL
jgi:large subunit ribosomal protein L15